MHKVSIIFGKEQVNKTLNGIKLSKKERALFMKDYSFNSKSEITAFCKGIDEAIGWQECYLVNHIK